MSTCCAVAVQYPCPCWHTRDTCSYKGKVYWNNCLSLTAPSRVTDVSLTKTETSIVRVTWTTPQSDRTISQYQLQYRRSGTTSWSSATPLSGSPPATDTLLTGLDAGTEYSIRVRAVSDVGAGEWSVEQIGRTFNSEFNASSTVIWCMVRFLLFQ